MSRVDDILAVIDGALDESPDPVAAAVERTLPYRDPECRPTLCWRCSVSTDDLRESSWLCHGCVMFLTEESDHDPKKWDRSTWGLAPYATPQEFNLVTDYNDVPGGPTIEDFIRLTSAFYGVAVNLAVRGRFSLELMPFNGHPEAEIDPGGYSLLLTTIIDNRIFQRLMFVEPGRVLDTNYTANVMLRDIMSEINPLTGQAE